MYAGLRMMQVPSEDDVIRLGLIGDNIRRSKSPLLHRLAGRLCSLDVTYEPLIPSDLGLDFDAVFDSCVHGAYRGINITYPYKERVVARLEVEEPLTRALGACNTVLFGDGTPKGFNTDCSGFRAAFRHAFPGETPGRVAMAGAGGVGKAIAFALADLGAEAIVLHDPDRPKALQLARALGAYAPQVIVEVAAAIEDAAGRADGLVNSTPLGMTGHQGRAFPDSTLKGPRWAFDAVYTPVETEFLLAARGAGLMTLSGYELFFFQGVDAFRLFTGCAVDAVALRAALLEPEHDLVHPA